MSEELDVGPSAVRRFSMDPVDAGIYLVVGVVALAAFVGPALPQVTDQLPQTLSSIAGPGAQGPGPAVQAPEAVTPNLADRPHRHADEPEDDASTVDQPDDQATPDGQDPVDGNQTVQDDHRGHGKGKRPRG